MNIRKANANDAEVLFVKWLVDKRSLGYAAHI